MRHVFSYMLKLIQYLISNRKIYFELLTPPKYQHHLPKYHLVVSSLHDDTKLISRATRSELEHHFDSENPTSHIAWTTAQRFSGSHVCNCLLSPIAYGTPSWAKIEPTVFNREHY